MAASPSERPARPGTTVGSGAPLAGVTAVVTTVGASPAQGRVRRAWLGVMAVLGCATVPLVAVGADNVGRLLNALAFVCAAVLCTDRARRTPAEGPTWRRFAVGSALLALATSTKWAMLVGGVLHGTWVALPVLSVLAAFPVLYSALARWDQAPRAVRDNRAVWTGTGAGLVVLAWLELATSRGVLVRGWSVPERVVVELTVATGTVLLLAVVVTALTARRAHDRRSWLPAVTVAGLVVLYTARVVNSPNQQWAPLVVSLGACALGSAAFLEPRPPRRPRERPAAGASVAMTIGSCAILLQVLVVLTLASLPEGPAPVVLALLAAATCGVRLHRNLRDLSSLALARWQASTDELTGTVNRRALLYRIEQTTQRGDRVCLAVLDIDNFRTINDALGQSEGDDLLVAVASRLQSVLPPCHLLGRLGGDDFAVVASTPDGAAAADPAEFGSRLGSALVEPFIVGGLELHLAASIGLATTDSADGLLLFTRAERALQESKRWRAGPVVHDLARHGDAAGTLRLVEELRAALAGDQLVLFLQPQLDVATGRVDGVEALVRWQHPERGLLGPAEFVPIVEEHGLIGALTERVLELAVGQLADLHAHRSELRMSVNLSVTNLFDDALPDRVLERIIAHGIDPTDLVLEITENVFLGDSPQVRGVLLRLAHLGCQLSIDDYGTGYSSLGYLRHLPVRELKLDRSYAAELLASSTTSVIVRSTIDLAHDLGLRVVAEGVEDGKTHAMLAELGCDVTQGYWHAQPMAAADLCIWMAGRHRRPQ